MNSKNPADPKKISWRTDPPLVVLTGGSEESSPRIAMFAFDEEPTLLGSPQKERVPEEPPDMSLFERTVLPGGGLLPSEQKMPQGLPGDPVTVMCLGLSTTTQCDEYNMTVVSPTINDQHFNIFDRLRRYEPIADLVRETFDEGGAVQTLVCPTTPSPRIGDKMYKLPEVLIGQFTKNFVRDELERLGATLRCGAPRVTTDLFFVALWVVSVCAFPKPKQLIGLCVRTGCSYRQLARVILTTVWNIISVCSPHQEIHIWIGDPNGKPPREFTGCNRPAHLGKILLECAQISKPLESFTTYTRFTMICNLIGGSYSLINEILGYQTIEEAVSEFEPLPLNPSIFGLKLNRQPKGRPVAVEGEPKEANVLKQRHGFRKI